MKRSVSLAIFATIVVMLASILPVIATDGNGWKGYPNMDAYSRCTHTGNFNTPGDTWTASGLQAWYAYNTPPAYVHGNYTFERGCGGQGSETYRTNGVMACDYVYGNTYQYYYDSGTPTRQSRYVQNIGWVDAWYQLSYTLLGTFIPERQSSVSGGASSYFYDPAQTQHQWYVTSFIEASHMTAGYP